MALVVVGVPSSAGAYGVGQEQAPAAFRKLGLVEALANARIDVRDGGDLSGFRMRPDSLHRKCQNLEAVVEVAARVRQRVRSLLEEGHVPLVLGGDCTITLGVLAGVVDVDPLASLAYFDGDVDISTPKTTRSGVLDAMVLAHILDLEGAATPLAGIGRRPLIPGRNISLIGFDVEDLDDDETDLLTKAEVHLFPSRETQIDPAATARRAVGALPPQSSRVVHFDIDAVDSIDCPLAHYPHFNSGVTLGSAIETLTQLCAPPGLAAVVLTEVNPLHDPEREYLPKLAQGLVSALANAPTVYPVRRIA